MYKPNLFARLFYDVQTLKLLQLLYLPTSVVTGHGYGNKEPETFFVKVYKEGSDDVVLDMTVWADSKRVDVCFVDGEGIGMTCPSVVIHHLSDIVRRNRKRSGRRYEEERIAEFLKRLEKSGLTD